MCEEYDYTNVEPTEEIMKLWTANPKYSRDEIEYVTCTDGTVVPVDFKNWSKDLNHDYSVVPDCPLRRYRDCVLREYARWGIIRKMTVEYGDELRDDVIKYLKKLKEFNRDLDVRIMLGVNSHATVNSYLNKQRRIPDCCIEGVLSDVFDVIICYDPKYLVKTQTAGYELMFIQRWYYRLIKENKND